MEKAYSEELVYIRSEDNLRLEGVVIRPTAKPADPTVFVWVHGHTDKFYSPHMV